MKNIIWNKIVFDKIFISRNLNWKKKSFTGLILEYESFKDRRENVKLTTILIKITNLVKDGSAMISSVILYWIKKSVSLMINFLIFFKKKVYELLETLLEITEID